MTNEADPDDYEDDDNQEKAKDATASVLKWAAVIGVCAAAGCLILIARDIAKLSPLFQDLNRPNPIDVDAAEAPTEDVAEPESEPEPAEDAEVVDLRPNTVGSEPFASSPDFAP